MNGLISFKWLKMFIFSALFFSIGCIEHFYNIEVLPEDNVSIYYRAKGDVMDFGDDRQLFPDSTQWSVNTWIEEEEDETANVMECKITVPVSSDLNNALDWGSNVKDSLQLQKVFSLKKSGQLFGTSWKFNGKLYSRRFNEQYGDIWDYVPEECRALEDESKTELMTASEIEMLEQRFSLGILQWNLARYANRFDQVWNGILTRIDNISDTSETTLSISRAGWIEDLHLYLNKLDIPDPNTVNLDWWEDLRPVFLGHIIDITGTDDLNIISKIADAYEREYQITKDIEDDIFRFVIRLPGHVVYSNGETNEDKLQSWEIPGNILLDQDGIIILDTFELSLWRVGLAALLTLLVLSYVRRRYRLKLDKK